MIIESLFQTTTNKDGSLSFDCQHGPIECDGNRIHACVVDVVQEPELQIGLVSCMIRDNIIPRDAFHRVSVMKQLLQLL